MVAGVVVTVVEVCCLHQLVKVHSGSCGLARLTNFAMIACNCTSVRMHREVQQPFIHSTIHPFNIIYRGR